jgi:hypothetical protein
VDLTPADFDILQDGKPQSISTFAYVAAGTGARPGETGAAGPILGPAGIRIRH